MGRENSLLTGRNFGRPRLREGQPSAAITWGWGEEDRTHWRLLLWASSSKSQISSASLQTKFRYGSNLFALYYHERGYSTHCHHGSVCVIEHTCSLIIDVDLENSTQKGPQTDDVFEPKTYNYAGFCRNVGVLVKLRYYIHQIAKCITIYDVAVAQEIE